MLCKQDRAATPFLFNTLSALFTPALIPSVENFVLTPIRAAFNVFY